MEPLVCECVGPDQLSSRVSHLLIPLSFESEKVVPDLSGQRSTAHPRDGGARDRLAKPPQLLRNGIGRSGILPGEQKTNTFLLQQRTSMRNLRGTGADIINTPSMRLQPFSTSL